MPEDKVRVFVAIELTSEIQKALGDLAEKLKNPDDKVTWVKPYNIHLTLKFLGNVPKGDIGALEKAISDVAGGFKEFNTTIRGTGVFPRERAPRVVWIGITDGEEEIKRIYLDLENKLASLGYPKEERSFTPHLTLGRVKYIKDIDKFIKNLHKYKENILGKMSVNSISLIKSILTPKGSIYEILSRAGTPRVQTRR